MKRMKENFDSKERLLLEERDKTAEAHKYDKIWHECENVSSKVIWPENQTSCIHNQNTYSVVQ